MSATHDDDRAGAVAGTAEPGWRRRAGDAWAAVAGVAVLLVGLVVVRDGEHGRHEHRADLLERPEQRVQELG